MKQAAGLSVCQKPAKGRILSIGIMKRLHSQKVLKRNDKRYII